ncbi:MAG TPA: hypothetical protein VFZ93_14745, partial [Albitalea sp.]
MMRRIGAFSAPKAISLAIAAISAPRPQGAAASCTSTSRPAAAAAQRRLAERHDMLALGRLAGREAQREVHEEQHRVVVADRALQQALEFGGAGGIMTFSPDAGTNIASRLWLLRTDGQALEPWVIGSGC